MAKNSLKKDRDGNIILKEPLTKKITVIVMLVFSTVIVLGSVWMMINGNLSVMNIIRLVLGLLIAAFSLWSLKKRDIYIITKEKFVAYGLWEVLLKDIDTVVLNDAKFYKVLVITSNGMEYTINQESVSVPLENVAEYLTKKLKKK
ncbi:MAG: hypothetical protein E7481_08500 [Ruminococcaceae bacterium]|nr:hypothetical protein [Oscillospiraceae bacterium]